MLPRIAQAIALAALVSAAGCSSAAVIDPPARGGPGAGASGGASGAGGATDAGGAGGSPGQPAGGSGLVGAGASSASHLKGKVVAPEGTIPISGALVYLAASTPPAIPDGVYCDTCVHLEPGVPYTTTNPDGTFDLGTSPGDALLVVQKGAFRRVRKLTVVAGDQDVPVELTTLPPMIDKGAGDDIPKIAVVLGAWDPIELVLARMGLAATISKGFLGSSQVLSKDAPAFAIYGLHGLGEQSPYPTAETLLTSPAELEKYHVLFLPCSGSTANGDSTAGPMCDGVFGSDPAITANLQGFVRKGGKLYVSDWSYEYVRQVFPGFVSWKGQDQAIGSACMSGGGEQPAKVDDPGLSAWLAAQGKSLDTVKDAWTYLEGVHPTMSLDAAGKAVTETPKVWVEAESQPATTSFKDGCGRVLYTTYHTQPTSAADAPLEPQALALLYLILEVGVCIDDPKLQ